MSLNKNENNIFNTKIVFKIKGTGTIQLFYDQVTKFGCTPFQFVSTPRGPAIVIGVSDSSNLYFWVRDDEGVCYWNNIKPGWSIRNKIDFSVNQAPFDYPAGLLQNLIDANISIRNGIVDVESLTTNGAAKKVIQNPSKAPLPPDTIFRKLLIELDESMTEEQNVNLTLKKHFLNNSGLYEQEILRILKNVKELLVNGKTFEANISNSYIPGVIKSLADIENKLKEQKLKLENDLKKFDTIPDENLKIPLQEYLRSVIRNLTRQITQNETVVQHNNILTDSLCKRKDNLGTKVNIINFLINFFQEMELDLLTPPLVIYRYQKISGAFADFIYDTTSDEGIDDNNRDMTPFKNALLFYFLSGATDSHTLKKECYIRLLQLRKVQPSQFDLAEYSQQSPQKFIEFYHSIKSMIDYPSNQLYFRLQIFKLKSLAAIAHERLQENNSYNEFEDEAKELLPSLITHPETKAVTIKFCDQYFANNFGILVTILSTADKCFTQESIEQKLLLAKNLYLKAKENNPKLSDKDVFFYGLLLLKSKHPQLNRDGHELIVQLINNDNQNAKEFLEEHLQKDFSLSLPVAKIYFELATVANQELQIKEYHTKAQSLCTDIIFAQNENKSVALYLRYKISKLFHKIIVLTDLVQCLQIPEALDELKQLADSGNQAACFELGMLYLNGTVVLLDNELAAKYFDMSKLPAAKYKLAEMILAEKIKSELDPFELLMSRGNNNRLDIRVKDLLIKCTKDKTSLHYPKACRALAELLSSTRNTQQEAIKYYIKYFKTISPDVNFFWKPLIDSELRKLLSTPILTSMFTRYYFQPYPNEFFSPGQIKSIVHELIQRSGGDICKLLLSHAVFREHLAEAQLVTALNLLKQIVDENYLVPRLKLLFNERKDQPLPSLYNWLELNPNILCLIAREKESVRHYYWKTFLETKSVVDILRQNNKSVISNNNNIIGHFMIHLFFSESKKEPVKPSLTPEEQYIIRKVEIFEIISDRIIELTSAPDKKEELKILGKLLTDLNPVENEDQLNNFIIDLCKNDYFIKFFPETKQNLLEINKRSHGM